MNPWLRGFAAVMMGLIVAFAVTFGIEFFNNQMYPLPVGTDPRDPVAMKAAIAQLPAMALGLWAGMRVFSVISEERFRRLVLWLILASGISLQF